MAHVKLSDCIYQHIGETFYYGIFGDFKLIIDKKTGHFNATKLCEQSGKSYFHWSSLETSKKLIGVNSVYEIKGNNKEINGIYIPQELILNIASWVSTEFNTKYDNITVEYFIQEYKNMTIETLRQRIKDADKQSDKWTLENQEYLRGLLKQRKSNISY